MKFLILIIMAASPGERVDHFLYKAEFQDVEECQAFAQTYWQPLTNLAMMAKGKPWGDIFCLPKDNADSELIDNVLNSKTI